MNIKEIALNVAKKMRESVYPNPYISEAAAIDFAEALVAELAKENKPVYAFRRKGLDYFCTCDEWRYNELAQKPALFEVRVFYTIPPTAEQIEQETAEACAKLVITDAGTCDSHVIATQLICGKWREYK